MRKKKLIYSLIIYFFVPLHSTCKKMMRVEDQPSLTMLLYGAFRYITHVYKRIITIEAYRYDEK